MAKYHRKTCCDQQIPDKLRLTASGEAYISLSSEPPVFELGLSYIAGSYIEAGKDFKKKPYDLINCQNFEESSPLENNTMAKPTQSNYCTLNAPQNILHFPQVDTWAKYHLMM